MNILAILLTFALENAFGYIPKKYQTIKGIQYADNPTQYPFMASIQLRKHICGGTIISKHFILTAAKCLNTLNSAKIKHIKIKVGTDDLSKKGDFYSVSKIIYHGNFNNGSTQFDIGLIKVKNPIKFNFKVKPISLETKYIDVNTRATIIGWTKVKMKRNNILKKLNVTIKYGNCPDKRIKIISDLQMVSFKKKRTNCVGTSGDPIVIKGKQIGIISSVSKTCKNCDISARISYFIPWIDAHINSINVNDIKISK